MWGPGRGSLGLDHWQEPDPAYPPEATAGPSRGHDPHSLDFYSTTSCLPLPDATAIGSVYGMEYPNVLIRRSRYDAEGLFACRHEWGHMCSDDRGIDERTLTRGWTGGSTVITLLTEGVLPEASRRENWPSLRGDPAFSEQPIADLPENRAENPAWDRRYVKPLSLTALREIAGHELSRRSVRGHTRARGYSTLPPDFFRSWSMSWG